MPTQSRNNIYLVGFMGAGKSTLGPLLAKAIGWSFVDSDKEIESSAGVPIEQLFKERGEPVFRELEKTTIKTISNRPNIVCAIGGGALQHSHTQLTQTGTIIYLRASAQTLFERLKDQSRPLLDNSPDKLKKIQILLEKRKENYENADHIVDVDQKTVNQTTSEILSFLSIGK